jgi:hypothetical protein
MVKLFFFSFKYAKIIISGTLNVLNYIRWYASWKVREPLMQFTDSAWKKTAWRGHMMPVEPNARYCILFQSIQFNPQSISMKLRSKFNVNWPDIFQPISPLPVTAETRFRARVSPCWICGGQSGWDSNLSEFFGFPLLISFHRGCP